jgi:hypothetical protein
MRLALSDLPGFAFGEILGPAGAGAGSPSAIRREGEEMTNG